MIETPQNTTRGGRRPGSGRKPRNTRTITLRLSPEVIAMQRLCAKHAKISLSEVAERALKEYLADFLKKDLTFQGLGRHS